MIDLIIGDLHFGERGNSPKWNNHLLDFVDWCIESYKGKVSYVILLGDYFHHRAKVQVDTINYALEAAKRLSEAFGKDKVLLLEGNHDLFHDDRLDISSVRMLEPYITIIDKVTVLEDMVLTPWIVDQEHYDAVADLANPNRYCFGHFEFNGFKMNDHYVMEHGQSHKALKKYKYVFSGHYHSYQEKDNVVYVGTPLPITMNEANEPHYVVLLDRESKTFSKVLYEGVKVVSVPYTMLEEVLSTLDPETTTIRVEFPDDLEDEMEISKAQELLEEGNFDDYKIKYRGNKAKMLVESESDEVTNVENIDESVVNFITSSSPVQGIDTNLLLSLYQEAKARSIENHE